jgi:hypothetical protein
MCPERRERADTPADATGYSYMRHAISAGDDVQNAGFNNASDHTPILATFWA